MARVRYLVEIFQKQSTNAFGPFTYSSTPITITDSVQMDRDKTIEATTDSFSIRLKNFNLSTGYNHTNIKVDDQVKIYFTSKEDITTQDDVDGGAVDNRSTYLRFDGLITQSDYEVTVDGRILSLKGQSRLNKLLNFTFPAVYEPTGAFTSVAAGPDDTTGVINSLIQAANDDNSNYQIGWHVDNDVTTTSIQYFRNYRPVLEMIQELSQQNINQEFNAYFYLDNDNNFVWKQRSKDTDTLSLTEGIDFHKIRISEKVWEVVNAVIVDCGTDPSGRNIHAMWYDEQSAAEYGLKWSNTIEPKNEICTSLIQDAQTRGVTWVDNADKNKLSFPNSYDVTLPWEGRNDDGTLTGSKVVVSSDAEWIDALRLEARWQGIEWAKSFISITGHVKPKVDIHINGVNWEQGTGRTSTSIENNLTSLALPIEQGDFVNITCATKGGDFTNGVRLRCVAVNHELGKSGWLTTLRFETDIDDAVDYKASSHE